MFIPSGSFLVAIGGFAIMGGSLIAIVCVRQLDLKVLIAYSSVRHIRLVISAMVFQRPLAFKAALLVILAHGISSSAIFFGANILYLQNHSRNLLIINGILATFPAFALLWFLACSLNMAAPPSLNLVGEILRANSFMGLEQTLVFPFGVRAFFAVGYSLIIYSASTQRQKKTLSLLSPIFSKKDAIILSSHRWLGVTLLLIIL